MDKEVCVWYSGDWLLYAPVIVFSKIHVRARFENWLDSSFLTCLNLRALFFMGPLPCTLCEWIFKRTKENFIFSHCLITYSKNVTYLQCSLSLEVTATVIAFIWSFIVVYDHMSLWNRWKKRIFHYHLLLHHCPWEFATYFHIRQ